MRLKGKYEEQQRGFDGEINELEQQVTKVCN
jgi:hypothetical protein